MKALLTGTDFARVRLKTLTDSDVRQWCHNNDLVRTIAAAPDSDVRQWCHSNDLVRTIAAAPDSDIRQWCHNNDPTRYAGALALQGHCAAWVRRLQGAYSTVVGLPPATTRRLPADIAGRGQDSHTKALP